MNTAANTQAAGEVLRLPVADIDADAIERIGFFHEAEVDALADVIASDGQYEPIVVAPPRRARRIDAGAWSMAGTG
jgi:ParB-like chromosome segregation protein Spo0J